MAERFPYVAWWCDRCGANLNIQSGFDDHHLSLLIRRKSCLLVR